MIKPYFATSAKYLATKRKRVVRKNRICYNCGEAGHIRPECPKLKEASENKAKVIEGPKKNARAFVLTAQEAAMIPDVIAGTFSLHDIYAKVFGANQNF